MDRVVLLFISGAGNIGKIFSKRGTKTNEKYINGSCLVFWFSFPFCLVYRVAILLLEIFDTFEHILRAILSVCECSNKIRKIEQNLWLINGFWYFCLSLVHFTGDAWCLTFGTTNISRFSSVLSWFVYKNNILRYIISETRENDAIPLEIHLPKLG